MVFIHGQMAKYMMVAGLKENNMEKPNLQTHKEKAKLAYGIWEKENNGLNNSPMKSKIGNIRRVETDY